MSTVVVNSAPLPSAYFNPYDNTELDALEPSG